MEVYTNLELAELDGILKADEDVLLQFTAIPSQAYCTHLNALLSDRKGVNIRFYNYEGAFKDLSFLKYIPNIEKLTLNDQHIKDISALGFLRKLRSFTLSKINYKKLDIGVLFELEKLSVLELVGINNLLPLLQANHNFKELYLTSVQLGNLEFLRNQKHLKNLDLATCTCANYEAIGQCDDLEYLCLEKENVENIDFVGNIQKLKFLRLQSLDIVELPSFERCIELKYIFLSRLNKLINYKRLATAPNLEEFTIMNVATLNIEDFDFIQKNTSIKKVSVDVKSRKTSNEFYAYLDTVLQNR